MATHSTGVFTLPMFTFSGSDQKSGEFTLPMFTMEGYMGSRGEFTLPLFVFSGTSISRAIHGEFVIPMPIFSGTIRRGTIGQGIFNLPQFVFTGESHTGSSGIFTLPMFVFSNLSPNHSVGVFDLPMFSFYGFGRQIPITKIYRGIIMNISNQAISTYSAFNFNSLAYFKDRYYGANDQGIFVLGGSKDNLTRNILSKLKTGSINFGDGVLKCIRQAWLTYRTDGHIQITFLADEDEDVTSVSQTEIVADNIREERLKCGKGLRGRFYTIILENLSGASFDIEQLSILVDSLTKRTR